MTRVFANLASCTSFGEHYDKDLIDLIEAAVDDLVAQGLDLNLIEAVVVGNMLGQVFDNQSQLGAVVSSRLGLNRPAVRLEAACASGGAALSYGIELIKAGSVENVLVIGAEKMTDYPTDRVSQALSTAGVSDNDTAFNIPFPATYALYANYWLKRGWIDRQTLFHISAKNHYQASLNPKAQFQKVIDYKTYQNSGWVAYPLNLFDCSPITDGAAAVWLSSQPAQKAIKLIDYQLAAGVNSPYLNHKLSGLSTVKKASQRLFSRAGIKPNQVDLAEVHDCFTIAEAMALVDLGLVKNDKLTSFYAAYWRNHKPPTGKPYINPSGGLKACGHPIGATGVKQVAEIYLQLTGQAGKRQLNKPVIGLSHNVGGSGGTVFLSLWQTFSLSTSRVDRTLSTF